MAISSRDAEIWQQYCAAEHAFVKARMALVREAASMAAMLDTALQRVAERGVALDLLLVLPVAASAPHLDSLVRLACISQRDIEPCRALVRRLYENGHNEKIVQIVDQVLRDGGEEEYLRVAELYAEIDAGLLAGHLEKCAQSADPDIQEIVEFFIRASGST